MRSIRILVINRTKKEVIKVTETINMHNNRYMKKYQKFGNLNFWKIIKMHKISENYLKCITNVMLLNPLIQNHY